MSPFTAFFAAFLPTLKLKHGSKHPMKFGKEIEDE
jgi:hypothetical protein